MERWVLAIKEEHTAFPEKPLTFSTLRDALAAAQLAGAMVTPVKVEIAEDDGDE